MLWKSFLKRLTKGPALEVVGYVHRYCQFCDKPQDCNMVRVRNTGAVVLACDGCYADILR